MAQKIIGRLKETQELTDLYNSKRPEFVVVQGRRRVGKTYLITELFQDEFAFYHTGLSPAESNIEDKTVLQNQLDAFFTSLVRFGYMGKTISSWLQAFDALTTLLEGKGKEKRQLVFIDELPWLDTPRSGFMPAFEHFWNGWGAGRSNLMLIVCGSATSWISDKILNSKGGLFNRTTYEIKLEPFCLKECEDFYKDRGVMMSRLDQLQAYMVTGGIPYYLSLIRKGRSIAQNIDDLFFAKDAKLGQEFDRLFNSLFANPEVNKKIIRQLGKKRYGMTRKELSGASGITSGGSLTGSIKALEASGFIGSFNNYDGPRTDVRYRVIDSFCLFWLYFKDKKKTTNERFWQDNLISPMLNAWRGYTFENICFLHVRQIKSALGIAGVQTETMPWLSRRKEGGAQIDMVIDRADNVINICEMKFSGSDYTIDKDTDEELRGKIDAFQSETHTKKSLQLTLITTFGLVRIQYSNSVQSLVRMDDLFKLI